MKALVVMFLILSSCAQDSSPRFTAEEMASVCNELNQKHQGKTKAQLYSLKIQARDLSNKYFYDNENFEKYNALYDEYGLAVDCAPQ